MPKSKKALEQAGVTKEESAPERLALLEAKARNRSSRSNVDETESNKDSVQLDIAVDEPKQKPKSANKESSVGNEVAVKPLPIWKVNERAGPNLLMRSSLFTIGGSRQGRWVAVASKPREVVCLGDYEIYQVGEELRQDDGDVLFGVLHLARTSARRGGEVQFVASDFIRQLGWNRDGHTYKRLSEIFRRLASTLIIVSGTSIKKGTFREAGFSLLDYEHIQDQSLAANDGGKWRIRIPVSTINLFWVGHYSRLHWDLRRNLKTTLSRYLHQLYITFSDRASFGVDQLWHLSGSQQKNISAFKNALAVAHDELVEQKVLDWWQWHDKKRTRITAMVTPISEQHTWVNQQLDLLEQGGAEGEGGEGK